MCARVFVDYHAKHKSVSGFPMKCQSNAGKQKDIQAHGSKKRQQPEEK